MRKGWVWMMFENERVAIYDCQGIFEEPKMKIEAVYGSLALLRNKVGNLTSG